MNSENFLEIKKSKLKHKLDAAEDYMNSVDPERVTTPVVYEEIVQILRLIHDGSLRIVEG